MKLVANIQLTPTAKQAKSLRDTRERCNAARNEISQRGHDGAATRQFDLRKLIYSDIEETFLLAAQAAVRCIAKVTASYATQKANDREGIVRFREHAAQPSDDRIFRFASGDIISIWTLGGRPKIPAVCGDRQRALLAFARARSI